MLCSCVCFPSDFGRTDGLHIPDDLHGRRNDRVWYGHVILLFSVVVPNFEKEQEETLELAWVQWYENFGSASRKDDNSVHVDPDFPTVLRDYFPRLYLPALDMGAAFDVVLVKNIICPAPLYDDISVPDEAIQRNGRGAPKATAPKAKVWLRVVACVWCLYSLTNSLSICSFCKEGGQEDEEETEEVQGIVSNLPIQIGVYFRYSLTVCLIHRLTCRVPAFQARICAQLHKCAATSRARSCTQASLQGVRLGRLSFVSPTCLCWK